MGPLVDRDDTKIVLRSFLYLFLYPTLNLFSLLRVDLDEIFLVVLNDQSVTLMRPSRYPSKAVSPE